MLNDECRNICLLYEFYERQFSVMNQLIQKLISPNGRQIWLLISDQFFKTYIFHCIVTRVFSVAECFSLRGWEEREGGGGSRILVSLRVHSKKILIRQTFSYRSVPSRFLPPSSVYLASLHFKIKLRKIKMASHCHGLLSLDPCKIASIPLG